MAVAVKLIVFLLYCANGVRISPKLDFGDSSSARPIFSTPNYNDGLVMTPGFGNSGFNVRKIDCVGNHCESTRTVKSDTSDSASADVLVHIKTNVNVPQTKNKTDVPDIPIIVGSNGPILYPENTPIIPYPIVPENIDPNYPQSSIGVNTIPGFNRRGLVPDFNYIPNNDGFNFDNYNRRAPGLNWYPQPRERSEHVHNPLEFKKTYRTVWPAEFHNEWNTFTNKRHADNSNPSWTPCLCENQPMQDFSIIRKLQEWNEFSGQ